MSVRIPWRVGAAVASFVMAASGCTISTADEKASTPGDDSDIALPADIAKAGTFDVAAFYNYPPYTEVKDGQLSGIEYDLINAVADELGVKARFHNLAFEAMIPSIVNKRNDVMIGALADTPDRRDEVSFVDVFSADLGVIVKAGNPKGVTAELCGHTSIDAAGNYQQHVVKKMSKECVADGKKPIKQIVISDPGAAFLGVVNGRADFTLQAPGVAVYTAKTNAGVDLLKERVTPRPKQVNGWIVAKNNTELQHAFGKAINNLIQDGTWQKLMAKYGLDKSALKQSLINGKPVE
ncbi:transporter substrate-binding domain-containing protein [Streptomyces fractus]|uniref:transporter substrate-binding domain-containing protein n=1 Tax=Streptomyces fractus TaxID=641806 RepID=UPI003CF46326